MLQTHLKRELIHAIWELLLDDEFIEAYKHGIVVKCADGVPCQLYPHFFLYGTDSPEKYPIFPNNNYIHWLIYSTEYKSLKHCPCPRCHIQKDQIRDLGTVNDMKCRKNVCEDDTETQEKVEKACQGIFKRGYSVVSNAFWNILDLTLLVPIWAHYYYQRIHITYCFLECYSSQSLASTSIPCSLLIYCMNLN